MSTLDRYKATLGTSADAMLAALASISDTRKEMSRLSVYAGLRSDEDLRDAPNLERRQLASTLFTELAEKTAWLAPEVQAIGDSKVQSFIAQSPALKARFDFFLAETLRAAPHTLGLEAESVLARTGDVLGQPFNVYPAARRRRTALSNDHDRRAAGQADAVGIREVPQFRRPCRA